MPNCFSPVFEFARLETIIKNLSYRIYLERNVDLSNSIVFALVREPAFETPVVEDSLEYPVSLDQSVLDASELPPKIAVGNDEVTAMFEHLKDEDWIVRIVTHEGNDLKTEENTFKIKLSHCPF